MDCSPQVGFTILQTDVTETRDIVRNTFNVSAWPAITYFSSIVITKQQCESDLDLKLDDIALGSGPTRLFGNTRLMLCVYGMTRTHVNLTLRYSRMATSNEDFQSFWGFSTEERDTPRWEYQFDPMVKDEIDSLLPLPSPFDAVYELCKLFGISKKTAYELCSDRRPRVDNRSISG